MLCTARPRGEPRDAGPRPARPALTSLASFGLRGPRQRALPFENPPETLVSGLCGGLLLVPSSPALPATWKVVAPVFLLTNRSATL